MIPRFRPGGREAKAGVAAVQGTTDSLVAAL